MTSYSRTRTELKENKLAPKKRFGQNFLVHKATAEAIVRAGEITKDEVIVEIGVGLGALTAPMAHAAKKVYGIEIDSGIIKYHEEKLDLPDNVELIHQDVLKVGFTDLAEKCGGRLKIMANLPYSISHPFIFKLIEHKELITTATIMLQEEVADRLLAQPSTKEYGIPTILLGACASIKKKMRLKPAEFHPRPKIDSAVITIDFTNGPKFEEYDEALFSRIVRSSFAQRRKTILNTLSADHFFHASKENKAKNKALTETTIKDAGFDVSLRPEVLSIEDFIILTRTFTKAMATQEA